MGQSSLWELEGLSWILSEISDTYFYENVLSVAFESLQMIQVHDVESQNNTKKSISSPR